MLVTVGLSLVYLYLGTRPSTPRLLRRLPDVVVHAAAYSLLGFSATIAARALAVTRPVLAGAAFSTAHGAALEGFQHLTPRRVAQLRDLVADAIGACAGAFLAGRLRRNMKNSR